MMIECPYCFTYKKLYEDCTNCGKISMGEASKKLALKLGRDPTLQDIWLDICERGKK